MQEISVETLIYELGLLSVVLVVMAGGSITVSRASLLASYPRQPSYRVLLANKTAAFTHKLLFPLYIPVSMKKRYFTQNKTTQVVIAWVSKASHTGLLQLAWWLDGSDVSWAIPPRAPIGLPCSHVVVACPDSQSLNITFINPSLKHPLGNLGLPHEEPIIKKHHQGLTQQFVKYAALLNTVHIYI